MERLFFVSLVVTGAGWLRALDPESCTIGNFHCSDGEEVSLCSRCDGYPDCNDASDEINCHAASVQCGPRGWQCGSGGPCLPKERICDGHPDCPDGSDEAGDNCKPQVTGPACEMDEFRCAPGAECFPVAWVCDGHADCLDRRDELGCESHFPESLPETPATTGTDGPNPEDKIPGDLVVISIVALLAVMLVAVSFALWIRRGVLHLPSSFSWDQDSIQPLAKGQP